MAQVYDAGAYHQNTFARLVDSSGAALDDKVQGNVASGATDSGNPVKVGGKYNSTLPTFTDGQRGDVQIDSKGNQQVRLMGTRATASDGFSNANIGFISDPATIATVTTLATAPYIFNGGGWDRHKKPNASHRLLSAAATTNATSVKASAGDVHKIAGYCAAAAAVFLKVYDKATAPTVGTDTPDLTYRLAPTANFNIELDGHYFSAGIAYAITAAAADADTTAVAAGDVVCLNITYA